MRWQRLRERRVLMRKIRDCGKTQRSNQRNRFHMQYCAALFETISGIHIKNTLVRTAGCERHVPLRDWIDFPAEVGVGCSGHFLHLYRLEIDASGAWPVRITYPSKSHFSEVAFAFEHYKLSCQWRTAHAQKYRLGVLRLRLVGWLPGAVHWNGSTCYPNLGASFHTFRE